MRYSNDQHSSIIVAIHQEEWKTAKWSLAMDIVHPSAIGRMLREYRAQQFDFGNEPRAKAIPQPLIVGSYCPQLFTGGRVEADPHRRSKASRTFANT